MYKQKIGYYNVPKHKYGNKQYDSKFEAGYGWELEMRQKAKEINSFETHQKIELIVNDYHICNYYIDFVVYHNDGTIEYVETKGFTTEVWRLKWKLFEALYSEKEGVTLTVVYQGKGTRPKIRKVKK